VLVPNNVDFLAGGGSLLVLDAVEVVRSDVDSSLL